MKKGVALIWALVLSSILLVVSGTMVGYITKESHFTVEIEDSTKAYAAAKTGIEWALYYTSRHGIAAGTYNLTALGSELPVTVVVEGTYGNFTINSTADSNGVLRSIEQKTGAAALTEVTDYKNHEFYNDNIGTNTESFTLKFDFWGHGLNTTDFGLDSTTSDTEFYTRFHETRGVELWAKSKNTDGTYTSQRSPAINIPLTAPEEAEPSRYRATMRYIKDTAASLKVEEKNADGSSYECKGIVTLDLTGRNLGNLNSLHYSPASYDYESPSKQNPAFSNIRLNNEKGHVFIDNIRFKK